MDKQKLLIIDDEPVNIRLIKEVLGNDYEYYFATNGNKGIEIAVSSPVDLILLDIVMPDINGFEVCTKLKNIVSTQDIPIIFITASISEEDEAKGLELGAVDYVSKPIRPAVLRVRVKNHLELKKHREALRKSAEIDVLTNIPNRRRFDYVYTSESKHSERTGNKLSVLMIDIDYFKHYNDTYGHAAGDHCIKQVAQTIKNTLHRPRDFVARYGGEEFVVLLPETDDEGASNVANEILKNIFNNKIEHESSKVSNYVTVSIGGTSAIILDKAKILKEADEMLYKAKANGRNQVCITQEHDYKI